MKVKVLNRIILISFITLISSINKISEGALRYTAAALFLAVLWSMILLSQKNVFVFYKYILLKKYSSSKWLLAYGILMLIGFGRAVFAGAISWSFGIYAMVLWITTFHYFIAAFPTLLNFTRFNQMYRYIFYSLQLYILVNFILYILGYVGNNFSIYATRMGFLARVFPNRVFYALAPGINSFGIISGAALCMSVVFFLDKIKQQSANKVLWLLLVLLNLFVMLSTDSRGALLGSVLVLISYPLFSFSRHILKIMLSLSLFVPLIILLMVSNLPAPVKDILALSEKGGLPLNGRLVIWDSFWVQAKHFNPMLLVGYGYIGQVVSHLSHDYSYLFSTLNRPNPELMSLHNMAYQTTIDLGLIGLAVLFGLIYAIYILVEKNIFIQSVNKRVFGVFVFYAIIAGTADLTFNVYNYYFLFMLSMYSILTDSAMFAAIASLKTSLSLSHERVALLEAA